VCLGADCNFCSLTGPIPDIFDNFPDLEQTYWDGNGLTGTIPASIGRCKKLKTMSFNINQLSGKIPDSLCDAPPDDCRIGSDTNLTAYLANYPWIQKVWLSARACCCGCMQDTYYEIAIDSAPACPLAPPAGPCCWLSNE